MSYKEKPQIKLYKYEDSAFVLKAIIDDYQECSFENNRFSAGKFSIAINYNIPNALLFERRLFVQFGNNPYNFGEIFDITDSIGPDGKGSQLRVITGYDVRYIFKRRIIKNLNNNDTWSMTAKGELCMRNLIQDQCGINAEEKRRLPIINTIPTSENAIGSEYSVSESFSNLYDVLTTIATQSEIGWRLNFNGTTLTLEFYSGMDRHLIVRFDTDYESLSEGQFTDTSSSFANAIFVGGKGTGSERDIYECESAISESSPNGLDRFEAWDNQSEMTTESEYEAEALSMLSQYNQTLQVSGKGLAKCPYEYSKEYNVGDIITLAFSGKSAVVQILSVTEHWVFGNYDLNFEFGKPQPDLNQQLQLLMRKIQKASSKTNSTESVKWYTIPADSEMPSSDVTFNTIGFTGTLSQNRTFTFYLDNEKTGAKNYTVYLKNLSGNYKLTLTTGRTGTTTVQVNGGINAVIKILIDDEGNVITQGIETTSTVESGNDLPVTSDAVANWTPNWVKGSIMRPTTANLYPKSNNGSLTHFLATSTMTTEKPARDGHIIHMSWDNTGGYGAQIFIPNSGTNTIPQWRCEKGGEWTAWKNFITEDNIASQSVAISKSLNGVVTCSTAGATAAKTVALEGFVLTKYAELVIDLQNANTVATPTLSVNGTTAKTIRINGSAVTASNLPAGIYKAYYGGTYWDFTTYQAYNAYSAYSASQATQANYTRGNAYCTTAGGTADKVADMRGYVLQSGATFPITFTNANSSASALTLSVNGTTAKPIYINGSASSSSNYTLPAGTYLCRYNGTNYYIDKSYAVPNARSANSATTATTANRIRTSAPSSPVNGDIWLE